MLYSPGKSRKRFLERLAVGCTSAEVFDGGFSVEIIRGKDGKYSGAVRTALGWGTPGRVAEGTLEIKSTKGFLGGCEIIVTFTDAKNPQDKAILSLAAGREYDKLELFKDGQRTPFDDLFGKMSCTADKTFTESAARCELNQIASISSPRAPVINVEREEDPSPSHLAE